MQKDTVQNIVCNVDPEAVARIWEERDRVWLGLTTPVSEEKVQELTEKISVFQQNLSKIEPAEVCKEWVMVAEEIWEDGVPGIYSSFYKKADFEKILAKAENIQIPDKCNEEEPAEYYKKIIFEWFGDGSINSYGYEFSPWEEVLGAEVFLSNAESYDKDAFAADILWELSFNGYTAEEQKERQEELEKAIEEVKEMSSLPKEEREKHFHSIDEIREKFGWETPSEEEKEKIRLNMYKDSAKTTVRKIAELRRLGEEIREEEEFGEMGETKYLYASHLGGFYDEDDVLDWECLYCEECGDSDEFLGAYKTEAERRALINQYYGETGDADDLWDEEEEKEDSADEPMSSDC